MAGLLGLGGGGGGGGSGAHPDKMHVKRNSGMFNISALAAGPVEESAEDGPLFHATVSELERGALALKSNLKQIIKLAQAYVERDRAVDQSFSELVAALSGMEALAPATEVISGVFAKLREAKDAYHHQVESLLVEPLQKMYENDLKTMEAQKKAFEQETQDYNQYLAKYLATDRDKKAAKLEKRDKQFLTRRVTYNLIRFDYLNFMEELHTRKEQEVLYHVSSLAEKYVGYYVRCHKAIDSSRADLERLNSRVSSSWTDITAWLKERQELRKLIEESGHAASEKIIERAAEKTSAGAKVNKFQGIRDLNPVHHAEGSGATGAGGRQASDKKEGSLYTKHGKRGEWRRVWCVLDNGVFQEYTNFKPDARPKQTVDLRTCTVKPSLKAERRFCFEIISPQLRNVYQATSHEEMTVWMQVIQSAIESALERRVSFQTMPLSADAVQDKDRVRRELLKDPTNAMCADCNARDPDWAVINHGVLVCIACSGVHRSLGTHISKVRSITLDTASWTPELLLLQRALGNGAVNTILEARPVAGLEKPAPAAARDDHLRFITAKYSTHALCVPRDPDVDPLQTLLQAAVQDDVLAAMRALAWGASPNALAAATVGGPADDALDDGGDGGDLDASGSVVGGDGGLMAAVVAAGASSSLTPGAAGVGFGGAADDTDLARAHSASGGLLDHPRRRGLGALHQAVQAGNVTVAEYLLQNGADVGLQDRGGWTPLHYAAEREDEAMIAYLITKGARVDARTLHGQRPVDLIGRELLGSRLAALLAPSPSSTVSAASAGSGVVPPTLTIAPPAAAAATNTTAANADGHLPHAVSPSVAHPLSLFGLPASAPASAPAPAPAHHAQPSGALAALAGAAFGLSAPRVASGSTGSTSQAPTPSTMSPVPPSKPSAPPSADGGAGSWV